MLHDFGRGHLIAWLCLPMLTALHPASAQICPFWEDRTPGPLPRFSGAMAYDSDRDRLVLYGGMGAYAQGDTWIRRVPVAGDANGDDAVDVVDLLILVQQFGLSQQDPLFDDCADFDTTGAVDVADLLEIISRWGWQAPGQG